MLVESKDFPVSAEAEVGHASVNEDSTQEYTSRGPNIDSITTATVYISFQIALDSIWNALVCHSKEPPVDEEWLPVNSAHVKGIASAL